ncbi:ATP-grasp domain-containing protein [Kluyvera intermedia]|uniref:ATP-grasp domain-containing protein n=1 Tax=Kluyvera intermedia TaxID=61648 RepID=UPI003525C7D1
MKTVIFLSDYEDEVEYQAVFDFLADDNIRGITVKPCEVSITNGSSGCCFYFRGEELKPDLVVGYAYLADLIPAIKLMKLWRMSGVKVLNGPEVLFSGQNKDLASAMFNSVEGIRHLPYYKFSALPEQEVLESIGFPLVAKPVNGACGCGLFKFDSCAELSEWVQLNGDIISNYYVQPYIAKQNNEDYRIVVVNHKACYGYSRRGVNGHWVTNLTQDGSAKIFEIHELPPDLIKMAEKSSEVAAALFCGVDIALDETGQPFIIEANTCPAIKISRYLPGADNTVEKTFAAFIRQELIRHDI